MWSTSEHAYQAMKMANAADAEFIRHVITPRLAKRYGNTYQKRPDWDSVKITIMHEILRAKFTVFFFREKLLDTGTQELIEGNTWNDTFWGVCNGLGENNLGKLLMLVREEISVE